MRVAAGPGDKSRGRPVQSTKRYMQTVRIAISFISERQGVGSERDEGRKKKERKKERGEVIYDKRGAASFMESVVLLLTTSSEGKNGRGWNQPILVTGNTGVRVFLRHPQMKKGRGLFWSYGAWLFSPDARRMNSCSANPSAVLFSSTIILPPARCPSRLPIPRSIRNAISGEIAIASQSIYR